MMASIQEKERSTCGGDLQESCKEEEKERDIKFQEKAKRKAEFVSNSIENQHVVTC
jgi:hypothetical protein